MISIEDFQKAGINIDDELIGNAALEWIQNNTTLEIDLSDPTTVEALPSLAKLFIVRFTELTKQSAGVTSESIEGLSQSFTDTSDISALLSMQAEELLGKWLITGGVRFVSASSRWKQWG